MLRKPCPAVFPARAHQAYGGLHAVVTVTEVIPLENQQIFPSSLGSRHWKAQSAIKKKQNSLQSVWVWSTLIVAWRRRVRWISCSLSTLPVCKTQINLNQVQTWWTAALRKPWSDLISLTEGVRGRVDAGDRLVPEGQRPQEAHLSSQRNPIKALAETTVPEKGGASHHRTRKRRPGRWWKSCRSWVCSGQQQHHLIEHLKRFPDAIKHAVMLPSCLLSLHCCGVSLIFPEHFWGL